MRVVRRFAVAGLDQAARDGGRRHLAVGAIDETSQVKQGERTAGVKRHYLGCAGKVANGITTVHLAYAREGTGHALIAARQWIPREHLEDPARREMMRLPPGLAFRTKGQLAIDILGEVLADGIGLDFVCGDEVYGSCTRLREYLEACAQAYVLRVPSNFCLTAARGVRLTCKAGRRDAAGRRAWLGGPLGRDRRQGPALVRLGVARHGLVPALPAHPPPPGQRRAGLSLLFRARWPAVSLPRLVRAAGCRWPVEEDFRSGKGCFGLDQSQVRLYAAIATRTRPQCRAARLTILAGAKVPGRGFSRLTSDLLVGLATAQNWMICVRSREQSPRLPGAQNRRSDFLPEWQKRMASDPNEIE